MSIQIAPFGEKAGLFTLENAAGTRLVLTDIGAAAVSLIYRGTDILLGWEDPDRYFDGDGSEGATVGRVVNRIADARFTLNGRTYSLARNDGRNNLHSGPDGYHTRLWTVAGKGENYVTFFMDSPDGDQGYPGHVQLSASYTLTEDDEVVLDGQGSGDILGHTLKLYAETFTPSTDDLIPTGEIWSVEGTPFDFRTAHAIGDHIDDDDPRLLSAGGYDLNFPVTGEGLRPAAELTRIRLRARAAAWLRCSRDSSSERCSRMYLEMAS